MIFTRHLQAGFLFGELAVLGMVVQVAWQEGTGDLVGKHGFSLDGRKKAR
jgi:hypothetical protein